MVSKTSIETPPLIKKQNKTNDMLEELMKNMEEMLSDVKEIKNILQIHNDKYINTNTIKDNILDDDWYNLEYH